MSKIELVFLHTIDAISPHKTQESEQNMSALSGYQRTTRFLNTQEDCIKEFLLKKLGRNVVVEVADYAFPEQEHIKTMNRLFDLSTTQQLNILHQEFIQVVCIIIRKPSWSIR